MPQALRRTAGGIHGRQSRGRPSRAATRAEHVLQLQRTAGNRATRAMIQRLDWGDVWDVVKGPVWRIPDIGGGVGGFALERVFDEVVASNRRSAKEWRVPDSYVWTVKAFALHAPEDGELLLKALKRNPRFHVGGWILDIQDGAEAMTLNRDVFCVKEPSVDTFVHELVHVKQYADVGPIRFLANYFGEAGYEVLRALIAQEDIDPFKASSYETEGYELEQRFKLWRESIAKLGGP